MSIDPQRLTAIPVFSELSEDEAKRLAAFATETSVPTGEFLVTEGDFSTELLAIEEGTADVLQAGTKIASLKRGDLIGEIGLLEGRARSADVVATSPMLLIKLTHWELRRMSRDTLKRIEALIAERQHGDDAEA